MGHRTVTAEIRRVVARLGGNPRVRAVPPVPVAVRGVDVAPPGTGALATGIQVAVLATSAPGTGAAAVRVPAPATDARPGAVRFPVRAGRSDAVVPTPEASRVPTGITAGRHALPRQVTTPAVTSVPPVRAGARKGPPSLGVARVRARAPLPRRAGVRAGRRTAAPLMETRRTRASWEHIARARLAANWRRLLDEHRLPAGELRLVGVYGPLPLGLVDGISLEDDGRLRVVLRRRAVPGPVGDIAVARHEPSGRLVRSAGPLTGGGGRGVH